MQRVISRNLKYIALIPAFGLLFLLLVEAAATIAKIANANSLTRHVELALTTNQLVHELQKERGMSAGYIGSQGEKFANQLPQQYRLTDNALKAVRDQLEQGGVDENKLRELSTLFSSLSRISDIRESVTELETDLPTALAYYSGNNKTILSLNATLAKFSDNPEVKQTLTVIFNFAFGKEQAGIERAVLSNGFARDNFSDPLFRKFIQLVTKQDTYINEAILFSNTETKQIIDSFLSSSEHKSVLEYRQLLDKRRQNLGVAAQDWFSASTKRINLLKQTQDKLFNEVSQSASAAVSSSWFILFVFTAIITGAIVLSLALYNALSLTGKQSLGIARTIRKVTKEQDLAARVEILSHDDLGKAAIQINDVLTSYQKDMSQFSDFSKQIGDSTQQTASSITQSETNLRLQRDGVTSMSDAIQNMAVSAEEISQLMKENNDRMAIALKETENGHDTVTKSTSSITSLAGKVSNLSDNIDTLNQNSSRISSMVDVIQSVAEQTNLLALNAAIEAARAGEQGRGFAVVADEVRALASRTQESTAEIADIVQSIQEGVSNTENTIGDLVIQSKSSVTDVQKLQTLLDSIVAEIQVIQSSTTQAFEAATEQAQTTIDLKQHISHIDQQAVENVDGAADIQKATSSIYGVASKMQQVISRYALTAKF